jgi:hypothetical protein
MSGMAHDSLVQKTREKKASCYFQADGVRVLLNGALTGIELFASSLAALEEQVG